MMNPFDRIIGYESIRKELERTADALKNTEIYSRLGVSAPRGLLLYGNPGVGKTLMASCLIDASGRTAYTCRKDHPDGEFVNVIRNVFEKAVQEAPSIVFLDDLDKFANNDNDHKDSEEYVTVQSCIDAARKSEVFVLATANDLDDLPESLTRPGRFDRLIEVDTPSGEDAAKIVRHYLESKACVADVDPETIACTMTGHSCAELETAINKAGLLAGYERSETITMRHLLLGCMDIVHHVSPDSILKGKSDIDSMRAAYHEAGHALVSELLFPNSVSVICLHEDHGCISGFTSYRCNHNIYTLDDRMNAVARIMGGRAATMQKFGVADLGCSKDVDHANHTLLTLTKDMVAFGFRFYDKGYENSDQLRFRQEQMAALKMDECYNRALRLIAENRELLDAIAKELLQNGLLVADDVQRVIRTTSNHEAFLHHDVL